MNVTAAYTAVSNRRALLLFVACAIGLAGYLNYLFFGHYGYGIGFHNDSFSYLESTPIRTVGYPLFLDLMSRLGGFPGNVAWAQLNLLLGALAFFSWQVGAVAGRPALAYVPLVIACGQAEYLVQSLGLLTESLFSALVMVHFGAVAAAIRHRGTVAFAAVGASAIVAVLVRPAGYFLLPGVAILIWLLRHGLDKRRLAALVLPVVVGWLAASLHTYVRFGVFGTQAFAGYSLVGHVAWAVEPDPTSRHPELSRRVAERLVPVYAQRPESLRYPYGYQLRTSAEYNRVLWQEVIPETRAYLAERDGVEPGEIAVNQLTSVLAREAIARHPDRYASHVLAHYLGLWRFLFAEPTGLGHSLTVLSKVTDEHRERVAAGFRRMLPEAREYDDPDGFAGVLAKALAGTWTVLGAAPRSLTSLGLMLSAVLLIAGVRSRREDVQFAAYLALALNGYLLLVAAVQTALPRYSLVLMPVAIAMFTLAAGFVPELWRQRRLGPTGSR